MKITKLGSDIITVNDNTLLDVNECKKKIHLIRLMITHPNTEKMDWLLSVYNRTKRFVIDIEYIKFYNYFFKKTNMKYYVINTDKYYTGLVSFFKRNNKVLLNTTVLNDIEQEFVFTSLIDILSNLEIIMIDKEKFLKYKSIFSKWNGDVIIKENDYVI